MELAVVEESITEEEVTEEAPAPAPEPVAEKKEEVTVAEKKEEVKEETVAEKSAPAAKKKASVDVMSIVSDVLAAERELVANEVAAEPAANGDQIPRTARRKAKLPVSR